ncbi:hypothetical protein EB796_005289 [Bugula neritina]|uniref:Uncharacterized protein n=1 Tax=Bugula neritina TaxID=10212 RepID=A0A7J7KCM2_BUGNE|nr:hypothetical protein EB796_005289 [Bugula neritina]
MCNMYGTTTGKDVYNHLLKAPKDFNLSLEKMSGFHSDGAPAMTKKNRLIGFFRKLYPWDSFLCFLCITVSYIKKTWQHRP